MTGFTVLGIVLLLLFVWFLDLGGLKTKLYVHMIVKMRVSPKRLQNIKTPKDYGMAFTNIDIITKDNVRLSAWEILAKEHSNKIILVNHPLTTTRYGSVEGLDGVTVEFLPMIKHLHDAGYNIIMYDHRGQGESDGGYGKTQKGVEAPVGAGVTEWQDVIASIEYVNNHPKFKDYSIALLSQCMGANATFLAWNKAPEQFNNSRIKCLVAIQPTISYKMVDRYIKLKTNMDLVQAVEQEQKRQFGFGYANALEDIKSVDIPILFSQVRKDQYTFDKGTKKNDIEQFFSNCPSQQKTMIWIGSDEAQSYGTNKRFDGYGYFNKHPEELINFLSVHL